ncbi:MAG: type I-B CRISPR-associated protein Cas5b [Bacillus sp. (in: Bacteria)]|nr:type I-B CRISPR-associated protein Cas5b [Bacillus sp. (in: firmicutes)]
MKALRLKLYQQTACYKKPFAFKVAETYPLPPHSTVKGMLHAALSATSLIPMKISVQGKYDTLITDYQTHYFFKKDKTKEFVLTADGLNVDRNMSDITSMPIYTHMLYDVSLLIHVYAEATILQDLVKVFTNGNSHLSLGRWEDLVRVDECELVELEESESEIQLKYDAFVPERLLGDVEYFPYKLNWTYRVVQGTRVWDKFNVGYVQEGSYLDEDEEFLQDSYGDVVLFPN